LEIGQRLVQLRTERGLTQEQLAELLNMSRSTYAQYEVDRRTPDADTIKLLADFFDVTTDYLLGRTDTPNRAENLPLLKPKDEREIAKDLESMLNSLNSETGMAAYDNDLDPEDMELLKASLETSMRLAKQMAKKKFTPKKYRKE
jgi:transcriptional regulator with XRE-family HTH domain